MIIIVGKESRKLLSSVRMCEKYLYQMRCKHLITDRLIYKNDNNLGIEECGQCGYKFNVFETHADMIETTKRWHEEMSKYHSEHAREHDMELGNDNT